MRPGCLVLLAALLVLGLAGGTAWIASRMLQEPEFIGAPGTADDGVRGQQKIYGIARSGPGGAKGRARQVVLSEQELNGFLSRHLAGAAKLPLTAGVVHLVGNGILEFKGQLTLRNLLAAAPLMTLADFLPAPWLERQIWLHLAARASLEVGAARGQRHYLRFDIEQLALGRQPLPETLLRLVLSPGILSLFRWQMPETVKAITIEPGMVVIKTAS